MRKGLTVTLLTVAIAMMGYNAMAMAPTVSDIRDVIVADDTPVSGANWFVYPDAINLFAAVSDDNVTSDALITWSFLDPTQSGKYTLNGVGSLGNSDDPVAPPAANIISGPGATTGDDPGAGDSDLFTVTIRNESLSPVATNATSGGTDPGVTGIVPAETLTITLFASDGDLAGSDTLTIFTENDAGVDRFSPEGAENVLDWTFTGSQDNGWLFGLGLAGASSAGTGASGMCITTALTGDNYGAWESPYGDVQLVDNAVYEIRLGMATTQGNADAIPVWNFLISNLEFSPGGAAPAVPANVYHGDYYFLSQFGGAQGIGTPNGRSEFLIYWAPAPIQMASWASSTTGAFAPAADAVNDMAFNFRVIDIDSNLPASASDEGVICVETMQVGRIDFDSLTRGTAVFDDSDLQSGDFESFGWGPANQGTLSFSGGNMTLAPPAGGWAGNIDLISPAGGAFPLAWDDDKLLLLELEMSAPSAADSTGAADALALMVDGAAAETFQINYILPNQGFGGAAPGALPVAPATATYSSFAYTNAASQATGGLNALRPRLDVLCATTLGVGNNTGSLTIHGVTVTEMGQ